jgi:hypothetical protein
MALSGRIRRLKFFREASDGRGFQWNAQPQLAFGEAHGVYRIQEFRTVVDPNFMRMPGESVCCVS